MNERNDHAAAARALIEWGEEWMGEEGSTDTTHLATAVHALTHAQLAVAEQLRIGNEIAQRQATFELEGGGAISCRNEAGPVERFAAALGVSNE